MVRLEGDGSTAPEAGRQDLESGTLGTEMRRDGASEGGDLGGAEEERSVDHVVEGNDGSFGVRNLVVFVMDACYSGWVSGVQELSSPHGGYGWGGGTSCYFAEGGHELDEACGVGHGVIEAEGEDETTAA